LVVAPGFCGVAVELFGGVAVPVCGFWFCVPMVPGLVVAAGGGVAVPAPVWPVPLVVAVPD
jgi:hypothetical protein